MLSIGLRFKQLIALDNFRFILFRKQGRGFLPSKLIWVTLFLLYFPPPHWYLPTSYSTHYSLAYPQNLGAELKTPGVRRLGGFPPIQLP